jgi:hypothetical protein
LAILEASFHLLHTQATADKPIGVMDRGDWVNAEELLAKYVGMQKVENPDRYFTNEFILAQRAR